MGQAKQRENAFLKAQPTCIFCGGSTPATTVDHQPARSLFDQKQWPEGYDFPACYDCNQASRKYENVLALLVRISAEEPQNNTQRAEIQKYITAMGNNFPDLLKVLSTSEKRQFFREEGLPKPPKTTFQEMGLVGIESGLAEEAIEFFFRKLFRALHYKHTGKIVPADAGFFLRWYTNAYTHRLDFFERVANALQGRPVIKRNGRGLEDQFCYAYAVASDAKGLSAYAIIFRTSLLGIGLVSFDASVLAPLDEPPSPH